MKMVICFIALLLPVQAPAARDGDDIRALIDKLHADRIEERQDAEERLRAVGPAANDALRLALQGAEGEFSIRVRRLLGMIEVSNRLTMNLLRTVPDLDLRLAGKDDHEWTLCLLDLVERDRSGEFGSPGLRPVDFNALAATAARGAKTKDERRTLCEIIGSYKLTAALGDVRGWLGNDETKYPALEALGRLGDRGTEAAILKMLREGGDSLREAAISALAEMGAKACVPEIVPMLRHRNLQNKATSALVKLKARSAVPAIALLLDAEDEDTRIGALDALAELGARDATPKLRPLLMAREARVRARAVSALGELDPPGGVELLGGMLDDPEWTVREATAFALGRVADRGKRSALTRLLKDAHPRVRQAALYAMRDLSSDDPVPEVLEGLSDPDPEVRVASAVVLGRRGVESAVTPLRKLSKDLAEKVRQAAVTALGRIGDEEAIPEVIELLKDESDSVREAAAEAAGLLGAQEAGPLLLEIFRNDKWAKSEAAMALGRLGRRESVPALVEWCLQEPSKWYDAERALEAMQDWNRVIGAMTGHLRAKDPSIRRQAITWLIRLRAREAATEIASMLRDPDFNVRSVAVRALGDLEARETAPNVLPLLEDPSRLIRRETLNTLGILGDAGMLQTIRKRVPLEHHSLRWDLALARFRLGDHESLPEFVEYLNHREAIVRADTVRWIGIMRAKKALPEVRRACQDADASVRMRSLEALSRIDPEGSVRSIVDALKDSDKSIVWEAIGLLGDLEAWDQAEEIRPLLKDVAIRVKAAEWLCEAGSWEGVDLLFSHHSHLKYLNALRAPEAWKRLKRVRVSRAELKGSLTDVLTTLGARAGVGFQRPDWPSAPQRRQMELQRRNWSSWNRDVFDGSSESSLGWLKTILFREDLEFIIQDNRICVFPEEEVEAAWASWIKDNRPKHK